MALILSPAFDLARDTRLKISTVLATLEAMFAIGDGTSLPRFCSPEMQQLCIGYSLLQAEQGMLAVSQHLMQHQLAEVAAVKNHSGV